MADAGATFLRSLAPTAAVFAKTNPGQDFGALISRIASDYPQLAPYLSNPEIAQILLEAAKNNPTAAQFQGAVQGSEWYRSKPPSERTWITTQLIDPARASQLSAQAAVRLHQAARIAGVNLTPDQFAKLTDQALAGGWDTDANEIQRRLVDMGRTQTLGPGQITATQDQLRATASNYAIPVSDTALRNWAVRINDGSQTAAGFEEYARSQAKLAFPTLAKQIDTGLTVKQIGDPYAQIAAQTLGINPDGIDWSKPKWQAALQGRDAKGEMTGPLDHLAWQQKLTTDKAYGYDQSQNGLSSAYQLVNTLATGFGQQVI